MHHVNIWIKQKKLQKLNPGSYKKRQNWQLENKLRNTNEGQLLKERRREIKQDQRRGEKTM